MLLRRSSFVWRIVLLVICVASAVPSKLLAVPYGTPILSPTNPRLERCLNLAGFTGNESCSEQTGAHDLGGCRMCCTAVEHCTLDTFGDSLSVREAARLNASVCRGNCIADKT